MDDLIKQIKGISLEYVRNYISIPALAWLVLPLILMDSFITSLCLNIAVYFTKVRHFEPLLIGEALSLYYGGSFLGALTGGALTLKFSTMRISSLSCITLGIAFFLLLNTNDVFYVKPLMIGIGFLINLLSTSNITSFIRTAKTSAEKKMQLINLELVVFNLCFSLSAFVLIKLGIEQINFILLVTSISLCVVGVLAYFMRNIDIFSAPKLIQKEKLCAPKSFISLSLVLATVITVGLIFSTIKVIYAPTIENRFGDTGISVFIASVNPWIIFLFQPFLINRIKKQDKIFMMGCGGFILGIGFFMFGFASSVGMSIFCLMLLTLGEMIYSPTSKGVVISLFENGREGFALGLWRAVFLGSGFFGPTISGLLAEKYGNILVWEFCGILGALCLILCIVIKQNNKSTQLIQSSNNLV